MKVINIKIILVFTSFLIPLGLNAQDVKAKKVQEVIKQQEKILESLNRLDKKILRVQDILEQQGREYASKKLAEAYKKLKSDIVDQDMEKVLRLLKNDQLANAIELQDTIKKKLETILDILLDRKNYENLNKEIEELEKKLKDLDGISEKEDKIIAELKKLMEEQKDAIPQELKDAKKELKNIISEQKEILENTKKNVNEAINEMDRSLKDVEKMIEEEKQAIRNTTAVQDLKELSKQSEELNRMINEQKELRESLSQDSQVTKAIEDVQKLLDKQKKLTKEPLDAEYKPGERDKAGNDIKDMLEKIEGLLNKQKKTAKITDFLSGLEDAQEKIKSLTLKHEKASKAAQLLQEKGENDPKYKSLLTSGQKRYAQNTLELAEAWEKAVEDQENRKFLDQAEGGQKLLQKIQDMVKDLKDASKAMDKAADHFSKDEFKEAEPLQKEAFEKLANAGEKAKGDEGVDELAKKLSQNLENEQNEIKGETKNLSSDLSKKIQGKDSPLSNSESFNEGAKEIDKSEAKMDEAAQSLSKKKPGDANYNQKKAIAHMEQAKELLKKAQDEIQQSSNPEDKLSKKAPQQKELAKETKDKGDDISKIQSPSTEKGGNKVKDAADAMDQASEKMTKGEAEKSSEHQEKAISDLGQALEELKKGIKETPLDKHIEKQKSLIDAGQKLGKNMTEAAKERPSSEDTLAKATQDIQEAGKKMEDAVEKMANKAPQPARDEMTRAIEKLNQAKDNIDKLINEKKERMAKARDLQNNLERNAAELTQKVDNMNKDYQGTPQEKDIKDLASEMHKARDTMNKANHQLENEQPSMAIPHQKETLEHLQNSAQTLKNINKSLMTKDEKKFAELQKRQQDIGKKLKNMSQKMENLAEQNKPHKKRLKRSQKEMDEALKNLEEAALKLGEQKPNDARGSQEKAMENLDQALSEMENIKTEELKPEQKKRLEELAKLQKKAEDESEKLQKALDKLQKKKAAESMKNAAGEMNKAGENMNKENTSESTDKAEDAKRHLQEVKRELEKEKWRYESLKQDEILFNLERNLADMLEKQKKIHKETCEFDVERQQYGKLSRRAKIKLGQELIPSQEALVGEAEKVSKVLEKEQSQVFSWIFKRVAVNMSEVVEFLKQGDTGSNTQTLELEITDRLAKLLEAMKNERKEREEQQKGGDEGEGPQTQPRILPPISELRMLRNMQIEIKEKTQTMAEQLKGEEKLDEFQRRRMQRLAHEEGALADITRRFIEAIKQQR